MPSDVTPSKLAEDMKKRLTINNNSSKNDNINMKEQLKHNNNSKHSKKKTLEKKKNSEFFIQIQFEPIPVKLLIVGIDNPATISSASFMHDVFFISFMIYL